jgi:hypothetical protein
MSFQKNWKKIKKLKFLIRKIRINKNQDFIKNIMKDCNNKQIKSLNIKNHLNKN